MTARIHVFIGTKAQLIKMGPVMRLLQDRGISYRFIHSGQHQETMQDLIANFGIKSPDVILHTGRDITGIVQMLLWAAKILFRGFFKPAWLWGSREKGYVLNHGDTFSTLLGTLLARLHGHQAVHVESGLRSFNFFHPFPEEITRVITMRLSTLAFAPGDWAAANLQKTGCEVVNTQENTLLDSTRLHLAVAAKPGLRPEGPYGLASIHRFENIFDKARLAWIVEQLVLCSQNRRLLFILHKPTRLKLEQGGLLARLEQCPGIELRPRYDHIDFLHLVSGADVVITDGGSNQEECHYLGKPCLIMRAHSERLEGLDANAVLARYDAAIIAGFMREPQRYQRPSLLERGISPSRVIVASLEARLFARQSCSS
ncbi:MAG: UDP-N-acetylglucosamine 2-epimerase [Pseudomonadota bacterium]